jgi:hypothetical protein
MKTTIKRTCKVYLEQNNMGTEVQNEDGDIDHPEIREVFSTT